MNTEFRKAVLPDEVPDLMAFDQEVFHEHSDDWFEEKYWEKECEPWWMLIDNTKVGCCAFEPNVDVSDSFEEDTRPLPGSLYISTTGILPAFRRQGFAKLMKAWQIAYARHNGFTRIVTNHRQSNGVIIRINEFFGFSILRTVPDYYDDEPAVVMELLLKPKE